MIESPNKKKDMKNYFTKLVLLVTVTSLLLASCSKDEPKTQNQVAARPTVPIQNGEVRIGTQVWMTRNLNVRRYRNGDLIPQVQNATAWPGLTTGAWCYYENNTANGPVYGKLYNWYAVNDPRGLAPIGYHVPTDAEWTALTTFLGGLDLAGGKMKAVGTSLWLSPNFEATNSSGFTGLPGGNRNDFGEFLNSGYNCLCWSSTQADTDAAWSCVLRNSQVRAWRNYTKKMFGISVRCIKD